MPAWRNPDDSLGGSSDPADVPEGATLLTDEELAEEMRARVAATSGRP